MPPLVLTTIDGDRIDLGALRGKKAVYLKFWATWCSPCREQMPHFEHVQQQAGDDLQVIAINIGFDDTVEQIKALRKEFGLTMPVVRDDDGKLGEVFGLRVTPQHVIIDKQGRIAYVGHLVDAKLETALADARRGDAAHRCRAGCRVGQDRERRRVQTHRQNDRRRCRAAGRSGSRAQDHAVLLLAVVRRLFREDAAGILGTMPRDARTAVRDRRARKSSAGSPSHSACGPPTTT